MSNSMLRSMITNEMDKFLERYRLPKFTQEELDNLNGPTHIKYIEFIV